MQEFSLILRIWVIFVTSTSATFLTQGELQNETIFQRVTIHADRKYFSDENRTNLRSLKSESFSGNFEDLTQVSEIASEEKIKSVCVQSGLWAIFNQQNYRDVGAIIYASAQPDDQACTNNGVNETDFRQYKSLRHIGNRLLRNEGISLYLGPFFTQEELYFDGFWLNLNQPINIRSFGFTGKGNWTLFKESGFRGFAACLQSSFKPNSFESYDSVVYNKDVNLTVWSLRRGCGFTSESDEDQSESILILPSGEIRKTVASFHEFGEIFINSTTPDSLELIQMTPNGKLSIFTDGNELRLPKSQTLVTVASFHGLSNWTIFSGTNFNGKSRCLFLPLSEPTSEFTEHGKNLIDLITKNEKIDETRSMTFSIGSIKRNCIPYESQQREPRLFEPKSKTIIKSKDKIFNASPGNQIFFISFLIALGFLVFFILLAISTVIYFFMRNRQK